MATKSSNDMHLTDKIEMLKENIPRVRKEIPTVQCGMQEIQKEWVLIQIFEPESFMTISMCKWIKK